MEKGLQNWMSQNLRNGEDVSSGPSADFELTKSRLPNIGSQESVAHALQGDGRSRAISKLLELTNSSDCQIRNRELPDVPKTRTAKRLFLGGFPSFERVQLGELSQFAAYEKKCQGRRKLNVNN